MNLMSRENDIGIFLQSDLDREIIRAASSACGLEIFDFFSPISPSSIANLPSLVVTDQSTGPWESTLGRGFPQSDQPTFVRVSDPHPRASSAEDTAFAFSLRRPLHLDSAKAVVQQASRLRHHLLDRHSALLDDLDHCRRIFNSISNGICIADANLPDNPITYVNPAFERITGYSAAEVRGRNCRFLQGPETEQPSLAAIRQCLHSGSETRAVVRNFRKDGTIFWNELSLSSIRDRTGRITHFVGIQNDITPQVKATEQLEFLAHHDALTGLANRALLMAQLHKSVEHARRHQTTLAVLYFDLNKFKEINDTFGHDAGDQLLLVVAARLRSITRGGETVARLGGDEFVVVLEDITADRHPLTVMQRLSEKLAESTSILGTKIRPGASIGLALFPQDGDTPEALLKSADFKMYLAKHDAHAALERQPAPSCPPAPGDHLIPQSARDSLSAR
jgi:diguanylate cyclase (GGDEF)-like protein/PAS domain S-box-containing protein